MAKLPVIIDTSTGSVQASRGTNTVLAAVLF
jgi:hypothetical protein